MYGGVAGVVHVCKCLNGYGSKDMCLIVGLCMLVVVEYGCGNMCMCIVYVCCGVVCGVV